MLTGLGRHGLCCCGLVCHISLWPISAVVPSQGWPRSERPIIVHNLFFILACLLFLFSVRWSGLSFMVEAFSLLAVGTSLIGTILGFSEFFKEQLNNLFLLPPSTQLLEVDCLSSKYIATLIILSMPINTP